MYVIKNSITDDMFSNFTDGGEIVWDSSSPWVFGRKCDALFVLYTCDELFPTSYVDCIGNCEEVKCTSSS